jgi:hypothetical protein
MATNPTIGSVQSSTNYNGNGKIRSVRQMIRAGVELLAHDIEAGHPEVLTECLKAIARFFWLSFGNILLISTQRPAARQVAGFKAWNELGRRVRQGEKGIMIYAPILSEPRQTENADAQPEPQLLGFRPVRVWDIDQTEGESADISNIVNLDLADVLTRLMELAATEGIQIEYSEKIAPAKSTSFRGVIRLLPDMQAQETTLALVREMAIQLLYGTQRRSFVTREVIRREALAVVFVVSHALGLMSEPESIELYQGNLSLFSESLEVIKRTASIILGAISPRDEQNEGGN